MTSDSRDCFDSPTLYDKTLIKIWNALSFSYIKEIIEPSEVENITASFLYAQWQLFLVNIQ